MQNSMLCSASMLSATGRIGMECSCCRHMRPPLRPQWRLGLSLQHRCSSKQLMNSALCMCAISWTAVRHCLIHITLLQSILLPQACWCSVAGFMQIGINRTRSLQVQHWYCSGDRTARACIKRCTCLVQQTHNDVEWHKQALTTSNFCDKQDLYTGQDLTISAADLHMGASMSTGRR